MPRTIGPYTLVNRIGGGGFGDVWSSHAPDGSDVACKVSRLRRSDPNGFRFLREIRYQSQLAHSSIMPVRDYDLEAEFPWFVVPLAEQTLAQAQRDLTQEQALAVVVRICEALSYAHKNGKVHRDLKPENILLLNNIDNGWVIADFGLKRAMDEKSSHQTATYAAGGTRGYSAPEQFTDFKSADERADIYACGQILHFLLDGTTIPPGGLAAISAGQFAYVVRRATSYAPEERYHQVEDFSSDLRLLAYGGSELRSPERQALSLLNQVAQDKVLTDIVTDLMRVLYPNRRDQRLFLNGWRLPTGLFRSRRAMSWISATH